MVALYCREGHTHRGHRRPSPTLIRLCCGNRRSFASLRMTGHVDHHVHGGHDEVFRLGDVVAGRAVDEAPDDLVELIALLRVREDIDRRGRVDIHLRAGVARREAEGRAAALHGRKAHAVRLLRGVAAAVTPGVILAGDVEHEVEAAAGAAGLFLAAVGLFLFLPLSGEDEVAVYFHLRPGSIGIPVAALPIVKGLPLGGGKAAALHLIHEFSLGVFFNFCGLHRSRTPAGIIGHGASI